ncbi:MAG: FAD/NAD(P)-binding protein [Acidimicrobiales bacterium]
MTPVPYRVVARREETSDVTTLTLAPLTSGPMTFRHGQFNMLTAFGVGEAAISVSSTGGAGDLLRHTVRDVGAVSHALCEARVGAVVGVRGPFGTDWGVDDTAADAEGDVMVVAGGIGLAPLRGAVDELVRRAPETGRRVYVIVGAREPGQIIFGEDLEAWSRSGARVTITVDVSAPGWSGHVGLVTARLREADFDAVGATALICGPEIMMRFTARDLVDRGVHPGRIRVSLERNMQCALAWCGHCQLGPFLLCRDGPIVPYDGVAAHLLSERER